MLETYFVKPRTDDRIRASWIGAEVERYAPVLYGGGTQRGDRQPAHGSSCSRFCSRCKARRARIV